MDLFILLFTNIVPLYLLIAAGFFAGRFLAFDRMTLANFALYLCVPVVVFGFIVDLNFKREYILLPVLTYAVSAVVAFLFLQLGRRVYGDNRANLLSVCASMGNTGYFGLPVALVLFPPEWVGVYMFMLVGITTFEATIGYYIAARGRWNVRDSLRKLAKFPSIYATLLGLAVNAAAVPLPTQFYTYWSYFKGAYVITGMMLIGVALSHVKTFSIAPKFLALSFAGKFIAWPLVTFAFIALDQNVLGLFSVEIYKLLYLMAIVPPAANIAAFAAQMDLRPEKAATTILLGTVFALFYIPLFMGLIAGMD